MSLEIFVAEFFQACEVQPVVFIDILTTAGSICMPTWASFASVPVASKGCWRRFGLVIKVDYAAVRVSIGLQYRDFSVICAFMGAPNRQPPTPDTRKRAVENFHRQPESGGAALKPPRISRVRHRVVGPTRASKGAWWRKVPEALFIAVATIISQEVYMEVYFSARSEAAIASEQLLFRVDAQVASWPVSSEGCWRHTGRVIEVDYAAVRVSIGLQYRDFSVICDFMGATNPTSPTGLVR